MRATYKGILDLTEAEWKKKKEKIKEFQNCAVCNARLVMNLCRSAKGKYYCPEHCPEHKWQSDYDCPRKCAKCGLYYEQYLEKLLEDNKISYLNKSQS